MCVEQKIQTLLSLQEFSDGLGQTGGSDFFVKEKLATILDEQPKPGFLGAIVVDSVMNYNSSTGSQVLPSGFDKVKVI